MAEGDITEGQGAANGGNINRAPRPRAPEARPSAISPAAQEALEVSARELVGLPATQREQDPRWQEVYQTKPDAGPAPKRDPNDPETDRLYLEWRGNNRDNEAEYRRKADEALKTADPDAFEHYQRYSIYSPAARDPEARHLFLDNKGNTVRPTDSEIEEFKQKYPEKAAIYGEAIENAKNRTPRGAQQRMGSLTNTEPQTYSFSPDDETTPPAQAGGGSSEPPRVPPGTAAAREEPGDDENLPPDEAVERFINNLRNQGLLHDDQESSEPPKTPESDPNPTPENIHDRQLVLDTFDQAFAAWEAYPEDRMTPDQVAARDLLREIKAKTTDIGKDTYTINFKAGPPGAERRVRQTEGPPVGSLMAFLTAQISSGELSPDELEEYAKWNRVLLANVKPYFKNKSRKEDEEKLLGRVNAEAQRVAGDERLATGDQLQDVRAGRTVLNGRWELSIPPVRKEKNPDTPLPPKPTITGDRDDTPWTDDEINDALIRDRDREDEFKDKVLDRFEEWKKHVHDPVKYDLQKLDNIEDVLHGWWVVSPDYIRDAGDLSNWPDEEIDDVLNHLWLPPNGEDNGPANPNGPTIIDGGGIDNGPQQPSGGKLENPNGNGGTTDNGGRTTEGNNTNEALPPVPPTPVEEVREIWFANRSSDIMKRAGELAETQLQHEQRRGNILNPLNWFRKSRMRIFEEYYRQVYTERAREAMRANHNSYLDLDVTKKGALAEAEHKIDQEREAGKAKIEQLKTGEFMKGQTVREATGELKTAILNEFVKKIVSGDIKDFATVQEKLREFIEKRQDDPQIKELFGKDANQYQRVADYFATDLLEMGALIKQDIDANRYALDQMDAYVSIKLANTEWGSEGQSKFNATDKLANFLRNGLGGPFKNPALAGAITSLGFYGAFRAVGYGGKAANFIVPGSGILTGAVLGAVRRNYDLKVDRASHQVARAYNYEIAPKSHNREQLEKFAYDTISVKQLVDGEGEGTARGLKKLLGENLTTNEAQAAVMNKIAEIRARLDISAEKDADLITFSGRTTVEQERLALIKSIVEAKIALKNAGLTDEQITAKTSDLGSEWRTKLEQNMQEKDKEFNRYRLSQSIKAGTIGAVAGLASGLLVKEIGGAALGFHDSSAVGKDLHNTLPHVGIVNKEVSHVSGTIGGDIHKAGDALGISKDFNSAKKFVEDNLGIHHRASEHAQGFNGGTGTIHETIRGNDISIPQGTELVNNGGHYDLIVAGHPDHTLVTNVVGPDGHVNLNAAGAAGEIHRQVASQDVLGPDGEWAKNSTNITRQWYGNNTPFSDRNELRVDNSVFSTANGQKGVDFDMSRMTGLSFQNGNSPEAIDVRQALAQGRMGISFTTDDNPQNAIFVALDPNGHLRLDPTDFAHHINADPNSMTRGEFSQIVLNQNALNNLKDGPLESELLNHRDVFNLSHGGRPGAIEVGVLTDGGPSGHRLNVLATGLGTGRTPATIETPHYAIDINKIPGAGDGLKHHGNEIPIIPIPYTPRHTLERMNGGNEEKIEPVASQTRGETLGPAETLEQGGIITGLTEQEKIPSYSISDTEDEKRKQILENVEIHGDEFDGKTLTTELLEQEGLGPKHEIKIEGGPTFYISDPYMASGGRAAVVGYVEKDGKLLARTYYRSGSQGVFRYLPGYRTDDMGNIDWFSKGFGEESITLPIYIQEGLANIVNSNPPKTVSDPNLIFAGTARNINKQMTSGNTYIQEVESKPVQLEGIFFPSDRNAKLAPETLTFANEGDAPNFAEPLATWNQSNNIYGNYVSQVFISKNKRYKYIFNKDASGKVWIGAVENNSPIQSTGLRQSWVTGGDLLTPAYEYAKQAGEFGNDGDKKGHYVDAFTNYLSKVQVIKDYIESQAQPKPAPTTLAESETEEPEKRLTVTPIEASDNTMAAVRMGLSKKLETSADNETVLSFTPEQLNLLFLSINRPSGITAQDFIATAKEGSFTDIDDETKRAITEGSLPDGWTISKVSL
ncbi:MAG TPA: hypothetical protein VHE53_03250, partial [Patescibacteria group bacterium]|nr:hypothetical protein [Patescibacteria group bacterium]